MPRLATVFVLLKWIRSFTCICIFLLFSVALAMGESSTASSNSTTPSQDDANSFLMKASDDETRWVMPSTLAFSYIPIDSKGVYEEIFEDFQRFLAKKTGKKIVYYSVYSHFAQLEAVRTGRLHITCFSPGALSAAVSEVGFVPIMVMGSEKKYQMYQLYVLVKKDSPIQELLDLKGKTVAHVLPTSNSGNYAPKALFPREGITPGKDYKIVFSGQHEQSVYGVGLGDYDAACIASDVYERMLETNRIQAKNFRIIWKSGDFPGSAFGYAHDLHPELVEKIKEAFAEYRFPPAMQQNFPKADRFFPIDYQRDFELVRLVNKNATLPK